MTHINNHIDYIEFQMLDSEKTKSFYNQLFGWEFTHWGEDYISFSGGGIDGGFTKTDSISCGGTLVILYSNNLQNTLKNVENIGAKITKPIFDFPGGRRFQFLDPNGNELAVWSEE